MAVTHPPLDPLRDISCQNYHAVMAAPMARIGIMTTSEGLSRIDFLSPDTALRLPQTGHARIAVEQLQHYFYDNPRWRFNLPLVVSGTPFQQRVWRALVELPVGVTVSYGQLAQKLKTAAQAVGNACGANPIPIIVPCHRVVGQKGIHGFCGQTQGWYPQIKQWLLHHEG